MATLDLPPSTDTVPALGREGSNAAVFDLAIRLVLLGILGYWVLSIVRPLFGIIIWSGVLSVALYPTFAWLAGIL